MAFKIGYAEGHKQALIAIMGFLSKAKKAYNIAADPGNTGDGYVSAERASTSPADETWTLTATSATNFTVTGSVSGAQAAATVDTEYDNGIVAFKIVAGDTAFVSGDEFTFDVADGLGATEAYTVEEYDDDYDAVGGHQVIFTAPGTSGTSQIRTGWQTYEDSGNDYYNWRLQGYTGYSGGQDFNNQPGAMSFAPNYNPKILLWNQKIKYWIVANGNAYVGFMKISTIYEPFGGGFLNACGLPNQVPYPLFVGGSCRAYYSDEKRWSSTDEAHRGFFDPYKQNDYGTLCLLHGGTWLHAGNWSSDSDNAYITSGINIWPYVHSDYSNYTPESNYANQAFRKLDKNFDGSYPLFDLLVAGNLPEDNTYGFIPFLYALPGTELSAEDLQVQGGDTYVVFPNVFRTNTWQYVAMKLE